MQFYEYGDLLPPAQKRVGLRWLEDPTQIGIPVQPLAEIHGTG